MSNLPTISIVVPSFNQAQYIGETLQSLVDQEYPRLDVVIQEGGSTDGSIDVARGFAERHPGIFKLFVEKDSGQADALNRGFARATGEILGFLNSDDLLLPRVLHRVAGEIDRARGRMVVMGRSLFVGEAGARYVGVEHPAEFVSHFEHLAIWKRGYNTIPQPSVFWHREVWERCGGFDTGEHHVLDYDLFCRMSKRYHIHRVDEVWSHYRMHDASKSAQRTESEVLDLSIRVSRKYWGPWFSPMRWRLALSHWLHDHHLHERARHHARKAEEAFDAKRALTAAGEFLRTAALSPTMARDRLLYPFLRNNAARVLGRVLVRPARFTGQYPDGWIGPLYRQELVVPGEASTLQVKLEFRPQPGHASVTVELRLDGKLADRASTTQHRFLRLAADVAARRGAQVALELRSSSYFCPRIALGGEDGRHLSLVLGSIEFSEVTEGTT
jgi:glycosyltransferase involved in cell wall biosynthesis